MKPLRLSVYYAAIVMLLAGCLPSLPESGLPPSDTYRVATDIHFQLARRDFLLHVPPGYHHDTPLPLVVVLHGAYSSAGQTELESGFSLLADREQFLVAYPEGIGLFGYLQSWNAGHCCGKAAEKDVDDVAFIAAVIDTASERMRIDPQRIYLTGMSNGGMLVHRFAAERGEMLTAAAVVNGAIGSSREGQPLWQISAPDQPLSMLLIHGDADQHVPPSGGISPLPGRGARSFVSLTQAAEFWSRANGCVPEARRLLLRDKHLDMRVWEGCRNDTRVEQIMLSGWQHRWPGNYFSDRLPTSAPLHGYNGSQEIWRFFKTGTNLPRP